MESFDRFQFARLALVCLKNETKADAERDLCELISAAGADMAEKARRDRLLRHLESADKAHRLELEKYSLERARACFGDGNQTMTLQDLAALDDKLNRLGERERVSE
jgi:hypothetical protein